jgi:hypothetical protein
MDNWPTADKGRLTPLLRVAHVRRSVLESVQGSVWAHVRYSVLDPVRDSVWGSVQDSIENIRETIRKAKGEGDA